MGWISWLLIIVVLVVLLGHATWVLVAWCFRTLVRMFGANEGRPIRAEMCPRCGASWDSRNRTGDCAFCGWSPRGAGSRLPARPEQILTYFRRRFEVYHRLGLLPTETLDRLVQALRVEPSLPSTPLTRQDPGRTHVAPGAPPAVAEVALPEGSGPAPAPDVAKSGPIPPVRDVVERARGYRSFIEERAEQPTETEAAPSAPVADRSQRALELLAVFLEQKNIRWGEVVGGLLIVGCSLALVLSFWSSIAERPILKFGLFTGVTASLFALGFHAERRWKLPTTALGLLLIATLLIPLNFLAVASLSRTAVVETPWGIAGELVAVALFAAMSYRGGRSLVPRAPLSLMAGVLVPSVAMLLIRRFVAPGGALTPFLALGATPLLAQGAAVAGLVRRVRCAPEIDEPAAVDLLRLLGLTTFAVALALGLLLAQGGPMPIALHRAAPLTPLAGAPAMAVGLLLWRRTVAADLVGYRTSGTAVAAAGVLVMLLGVLLGWPDPAGMIPVALLNFAVLTAIAVVFAVPAAHAIAGACLGLAYLLLWHCAAGSLGMQVAAPADAVDALLSGSSGSALVPFALFFGASAAVGLRAGRRLDAQGYAMVAALSAVIGLGLATWFGFGRAGDPAGAARVYAVLAMAFLAAAAWFGRYPLLDKADGSIEARALGWAGSGLILAALVQSIVFGRLVPGLALPWVVATLTHATLAAASSAILGRWPWGRSPTGTILGTLWGQSALATSIVAAVGLAIAVPDASSSGLATRSIWLALVWLVLADRFASPALFAAFQAILSGSVVFAVATLLERRDWYSGAAVPWLDPWTLQAQALAQGVLCLGWIGIRVGIETWRGGRPRPDAPTPKTMTLLDPPWPAFDRFLRGAVVFALVALAIYGAIPGAVQELTTVDAAGARVVPSAGAFEIDHVPHDHALGGGSWALLALVLVVLLAGQWERFRRDDLLGALVAASMTVPLLAGRWEGDVAVASALRWWGAAFLLAASGAIWGRARLARWGGRLGWQSKPGAPDEDPGHAIGTLFAAASLPLIAVTLHVVNASLAATPIVGPEPGSFFARIGPAASYATPLVLVAVTLAGCAIRERTSAFALAAGLLLNLSATSGSLLEGVPARYPFDAWLWTRLAHLNAIVASATALAWIGSVAFLRRRQGQPGPAPADGYLAVMMALGLALNLVVVIAGTTGLFLDPLPAAAHRAIAGPWGWASCLLAMGAFAAWAKQGGRSIAPDWPCLGLVYAAEFLAMGLVFEDKGGWLTYHGLLAGHATAGGVLMLLTWQRAGLRLAAVPDDTRAAVVRWSTLALCLVVLFAIRGYWSDPQSPWWTVGGLASMVPLAATLAIWSRRPSFVVVGGLLLNLAVMSWWFDSPWSRTAGDARTVITDLLNLNVIAMALPAPAWLWIDRRLLDPGRSSLRWGMSWPGGLGSVPFQRVVAWIALGLLAFVVINGLAGDAAGGGSRPSMLMGWGALGAASIAMAAGLWDVRSRGSVAGLYLLGLCASGWAIHELHLPARWLVWTGTVVVAAFSVVTSFLWSRRAALRGLADRLGIARPDAEDPIAGLDWLAPANLLLAASVLILAFGTILTEPEVVLRSIAANAVLAEVLAIGLLARGERRLRLQMLALCVGIAGALALGWSGIAPGARNGVLDRIVVVLVALIAAGALYGIGLVKLFPKETEWTVAARRLVPGVLAMGGGVLALVLGVELFERWSGQAVAMSSPAVVAVVAALIGAGVAALVAALVPGRDPLGLSERGRTAYVYGCEALLALVAIHLKLTVPWMFSGYLARYMPLIVLGIAFLGVGLGELFRRQGRLVLAEPLERTGALLPALPILGAFWATPRPGEDVVFLVIAGGLYAVLSLLRSSLGFAAMASLAFNAALWVVLGRRDGLGLLEHPQLWIIPPALCVLIGAYLNRDRLSATQATSIRYATLLLIYLSSTADIVLTGVAQAPWLPLALAALSLAGIFAGIFLRVRGFLILGLGFLALSLFTIIWYAAVDLHQTWLWAASGIVAGVLILAIFALFEKKRQDILRMVDQIKEWNP